MDHELKNFSQFTHRLPMLRRARLQLSVVGKVLGQRVLKRIGKLTARRKAAIRFLPHAGNSITFAELHYINGERTGAAENKKVHLASVDIDLSDVLSSHESFSDPEDRSALYRFRFLPFLAKMGKVGDEQILPGLPERLRSLQVDEMFAHPYATSERIIHLTWALSIRASQLPSVKQKPWFAEWSTLICDQANYLSSNVELHLGHHNHLINNARALLTAATAFPGHKDSENWKEKAIRIFQNEWPYQILGDGAHAEQSLSYHFLLTRTLWEFKMLFRQNGVEFPFEDDLSRMVLYASVMIRPDGTIPFLGHITPDWSWKDLRGLLPVWGAPGEPSALASLYKKDGASSFKSPAEGMEVLVFQNVGQGVIRSQALHVILCCDSNPAVAIHGDQNRLGIDVWWHGTHLVRDTGLSSYNFDVRRTWFESAAGQSTLTIDRLEPVVTSWRQRQLPGSYCQSTGSVSRGVDGHALVASHSGYHRLPNPVTVSRSISVQDETLVVIDTATGTGEHHYKAAFHFGHVAAIPATENSITLFDAVTGRRFLFSWKYVLLDGIVKGDFAEGYGSCSKGDVAEFSTAFVGDLKVEYTIVPC